MFGSAQTLRQFAVVLLCLPGTVLAGDDPAPRCATPDEARKVRAFYAQGGSVPATLMAARRLDVPEAVVATALPEDWVVSIAGAHFRDVWQTLESWDDATFIVTKGAHVFEIQGPVHAGKNSTRSKFFNLDYGVGGVGGHLRPDTVAAIHAVSLQHDDRSTLGVVYTDAAGESPFAIYITRENEAPDETKKALFKVTRDLMMKKPRVCN